MSMNTDLAYHTFTISPPQQVHKGLLLQATESGLVVTTDGSYAAEQAAQAAKDASTTSPTKINPNPPPSPPQACLGRN